MAQVIKIKRSDSTATPGSNLAKGELGYSYNSNKLFIGDGSTFDIIGGELYVNMLDHTAGTLTASSAILVGSDKKINELLVGDIVITGSSDTISTASGSNDLTLAPSGNLVITHGGTINIESQSNQLLIPDNASAALNIGEDSSGSLVSYLKFVTTDSSEKVVVGKQLEIPGGITFPTSDGSSGQVLQTDGSGALSFATISSNITLAADSGANDTYTTGQTLTFSGTDPVNTAVSDNEITISVTDATTSAKGVASFATANFTVSSGAVSAKDITLNSDSGSAAATIGESFSIDGGSGISTSATGTTLTVAADTGTASAKGIVIVAGGTGLTASYSAGTVTLSGDNATTSSKGIASFNSNDFSVSNGAVSIGSLSNSQLDNSSITFGNTAAALGTTVTSFSGLSTVTATGAITGGSLTADNITINGNEISSTDANGDISLNPNGTGTIDANNARVVNVSDPTGAQDAATKGYVDAVKQALDIKDSVRVATTANINIATALNVGDTIDGVELADGDRVLVKNQSTQGENGIYVAGATPARSADANTAAELTGGTFVFVEEGTVNADNGYVFTHNGTPATFGTTAMPVAQFSGAGQVIAGDAITKSGNTLNVNDDNKTLEVSSDTLRIKGISATAVGDLLIGAGTNTGYTALAKPSSNGAFLTMGTAGTASWTTTIDGGTF